MSGDGDIKGLLSCFIDIYLYRPENDNSLSLFVLEFSFVMYEHYHVCI